MSGDPAVAWLALSGALAMWPSVRAPIRRRVKAFRVMPPVSVSEPDPAAKVRRRRWALAAAAGVGGGLLVGGLVGLAVGTATVVAAERVLRRVAGRPETGRRAALVRDLPVGCDLLAVCLAGGSPTGSALAAVASAVPGPLGEELARVAGLYRLGAEPRRAWADAPPELAVLGRVLARAGESGSAAQPALRGVAAEARSAARAAIEAAVRRAGVWVLAPLGLCFLPAFVCLGVAPLVLGLAHDVFG